MQSQMSSNSNVGSIDAITNELQRHTLKLLRQTCEQDSEGHRLMRSMLLGCDWHACKEEEFKGPR